jgi:hypothetical protein
LPGPQVRLAWVPRVGADSDRARVGSAPAILPSRQDCRARWVRLAATAPRVTCRARPGSAALERQKSSRSVGFGRRSIGARATALLPRPSDQSATPISCATATACSAWSAPTGASFATSAASRPANSASSSGSTTYFSARRPCLSAFCGARALPSGDLGPRDFAPFLRLASARALLTETAARGELGN